MLKIVLGKYINLWKLNFKRVNNIFKVNWEMLEQNRIFYQASTLMIHDCLWKVTADKKFLLQTIFLFTITCNCFKKLTQPDKYFRIRMSFC